ncbi:beta-phosphoglucomutase [Pedobacter antarcticus 4BY]|uniref:Beta-phosphoglucomutase n=2 Tax=Pedobacter antarcticus TaxID=34086 RepID=A0A081PH29_9SPHI|nr:beta-phosphoglucomutase [Pedobacter antarcticus]KEQ30002.1 beta-phosphoglucomutase [Pedobacter antarcticus 4BY]SFF29520.1 beta-phosphoglucomutase [Pedobacter antarcticus]
MNTTQIACIFDLDGVLVDTAVYHYQAWKKLANSLGFDFSHAQNEQLKGVNRQRSLEKILNWGGITKTAAEQEELAALKNSWYVEMISKMSDTEVLPGSLKLLTELQAAGVPVALGSASKNSGLILERTGLSHFFNAIVDGNSVTSSKPDPEVFLKGAELLRTEPSNCVVFEDAAAGVEAALAAKMAVVGIGTAENLPGADVVIEDLSKINLEKLKALLQHKS